MITQAVILAAGRGSRLKEITATRSKAMAPVAGIPMIGRVLERLRAAGINKFVIVAAPHDEELRAYVAPDSAIRVVTQQTARGSGDALRACVGAISGEFLVCACDSLIPIESLVGIMRLHESHGAAASVGVMEVAADVSLASRSVVTLEGDRVLEFIEKPQAHERRSNVTGLPLYVLSDEAFSELETLELSPRGEYELPGIFTSLIAKGRDVMAYRVEVREDLTDAKDLRALNERFLRETPSKVSIHPSVKVPPTSRIVPPVLIEEGVTIGEGANIGPAVYIERGVEIAAGSSIERALVTRGARVEGIVRDRVVVKGDG